MAEESGPDIVLSFPFSHVEHRTTAAAATTILVSPQSKEICEVRKPKDCGEEAKLVTCINVTYTDGKKRGGREELSGSQEVPEMWTMNPVRR